MDAFPGAFTIMDADGRVISCNSYFRNLIAGKENDDLSGLNTFELFHPEDQALAFAKVSTILEQGTEETADLRIRLHGGDTYHWFRISTKRLIVDNEIYLMSAGTDIEEYKTTEKQLTFSNEYLRFILAESKTGSWDWDINTNVNKWSDEIWELYGLAKNSCEASYESWKNAIIEEDRATTEQQVTEASGKGNPFRIEWRVIYPDGSLHWLMSRGTPFRDASGKLTHYVGIVIDITESKEAQRQLKESEERFRHFFEYHSAIMMILDPETGQIIDVNKAAADYYGWSKEQLKTMNVMEMNVEKPEYSRSRLDAWKTAETRTFIVTHRKADGTICDIEVFGKKIVIHGRGLAFLILHDITQRKQFQQALVESNERIHFILNAANAGTWESSVESGESTWSDEIWKLFCIEPHSCSPSTSNLLKTVIPEDRPSVEHAIESVRQTGTEFSAIWRIRDTEGGFRWLMSKGNPVRNAAGKTVRYVGILLDITKQKRMEEEKMQLESRIRRGERMETLGTLAGGIAHDFNNILTPILSYAEMGMLQLPDKTQLHTYFHEITLAAERAQNLVNQILAFSKTRDSESSSVSVQSIIDETLMLLRPSIPSTIRIEKHINPACSNIFADPSRIYQVILNLCTNASQAMADTGGTLLIELDEVTPDSRLLKKFPELHVKPYVQLAISDTGHGMNEKTMDRIFEPFFTTKPVNKGTGLGLSVVHGIVTGYHGVIDVESRLGEGSTFRIYLPVCRRHTTAIEQKDCVHGGPVRILLVDDEVSVLEVMTMMLTHFGHKLVTLNSPRQALERLQRSPHEFDLVITDMTMPEMTGITFASELYSCRPELPVILMTGYEKGINNCETEKSNIVRRLNKPVRLEALLTAIKEAVCRDKV